MNRITYLDGWRGLAILGVLTDHFLFHDVINLGRLGVELFFVLSGRLMAELLFVRKTPLRPFFIRRLTRIYPALLVFLAVIYGVSLMSGMFRIPFWSLFCALTLTANYYSIYASHVLVFDHIWTLCIEEHIYLVLGGIAVLTTRRAVPACMIIICLAGLFILNGALQSWAWHLDYYKVYWRTDVRGASILMGAAAYLFMDKIQPGHWLHHRFTPVMFAAAGFVLSFQLIPDPLKYSAGSLCLAICVCTLPNLTGRGRRLLENSNIIWLGTISYSLYLWQQPFAEIQNHVWRIAVLPVVLFIAFVSFQVIETPARRLLNRRFAAG